MKRLAALLLGLLLVAQPALAVTLTAAGAANSNSVTVASQVITTSATIPAGALIVCEVYDQDTTIGTFADSATDTFHLAVSQVAGGGAAPEVGIFYAYNAIGETSGGTITYTVGGANTYVSISCQYATGMNTTSAVLDNTVSHSTTSNNPQSSGVLTPSFIGDLFVGLVGNLSSGTASQPSGFSTPPGFLNLTGAFAGNYALGGNLTDSGITAQNYSITWSGSNKSAGAMAAFKVSGALPGTTNHNLLLLGVGQ